MSKKHDRGGARLESLRRTCPSCGGTGRHHTLRCVTCDGTGRTK